MSNINLSAYIEGIGLLGPGLTDWPSSVAMLRGEQPYVTQNTVLPAPALLPAAERRRASVTVKLNLAVGAQATQAAGVDAATLRTVFTSSGADGETCHAICDVLASNDRRISPTRFHNSVHNAASGYWSIATGAMASSSVIGAFDGSFSAGLLEAAVQVNVDNTRVLLLACDTRYPELLGSARPIRDVMGLAFVLAPAPSEKAIAKIAIELTDAAAQTLSDAALEQLRLGIPVARALPLLASLARRERDSLVLEYLEDTGLAVNVEPC